MGSPRRAKGASWVKDYDPNCPSLAEGRPLCLGGSSREKPALGSGAGAARGRPRLGKAALPPPGRCGPCPRGRGGGHCGLCCLGKYCECCVLSKGTAAGPQEVEGHADLTSAIYFTHVTPPRTTERGLGPTVLAPHGGLSETQEKGALLPRPGPSGLGHGHGGAGLKGQPEPHRPVCESRAQTQSRSKQAESHVAFRAPSASKRSESSGSMATQHVTKLPLAPLSPLLCPGSLL